MTDKGDGIAKSRKRKGRRTQAHPSALERKVHEMLRNANIPFLIHPVIETLVGGKWRRLEPDILIPSELRIIEVNGCFVHGCKECMGDRGRDRLLRHEVKVRSLERAGYTVETVWQCEIDGKRSKEILLVA